MDLITAYGDFLESAQRVLSLVATLILKLLICCGTEILSFITG